MTPHTDEQENPHCFRCGVEITPDMTAWGIYERKWCSIEHKRLDEEGDWV